MMDENDENDENVFNFPLGYVDIVDMYHQNAYLFPTNAYQFSPTWGQHAK